MNFEQHFIEEVKELRKRCAEQNIPNIQIKALAEGRVDGDLKISFIIAGYYGEKEVVARSFEEAMIEYVKRNRFDKANNPLQLTASNTVEEDEIPF